MLFLNQYTYITIVVYIHNVKSFMTVFTRPPVEHNRCTGAGLKAVIFINIQTI